MKARWFWLLYIAGSVVWAVLVAWFLRARGCRREALPGAVRRRLTAF